MGLLGLLDERRSRLGFDTPAVRFGGLDFGRGLLGRLVDFLSAFFHGHGDFIISVHHLRRRV